MEKRRASARFIGITVEAVLRPCEIYPVRVPCTNGYVWEWAALDRSVKSSCTFDYFFECLNDARLHGYEPHFIDAENTAELEVVPVTAPA